MKLAMLFVGLCSISLSVFAQSSVKISGALKVAVVHGNGGSTPLDANNSDGWAMHDHSSVLSFSGKEDLGGGLYAGFNLTTFANIDNGTVGGGGIMWSSKSVAQIGGSFGEIYLGRALTPAAFLVLFSDPWYWDGSAVQLGWQIQQANYLSTGFLRTDNTVGYNSPRIGGFAASAAVSAGEGARSRDVGFSADYKQGPVWLGVGYDRSHGFANHATNDHMAVITGAYDFGVVRPMFSFTSSRVADVKYRSYTVALTAPAGPSGLVKAAFGSLDDFNTATPAKERLNKLSLGYQHALSKRTNVFADISQARGETASANRHLELGIEHGF